MGFMWHSKYALHIAGIAAAVFCIGGALLIGNMLLFAAPQHEAQTEQVTIPLNNSVSDSRELATFLAEQGYVKSAFGFRIAFMGLSGISAVCVDCFTPGAYRLSKVMTAHEIAEVMHAGPYMKWVVIPEGYRKEQIAALMQSVLGWSEAQVKAFVTVDTQKDPNESEGVYFPDTYLIPVSESTAEVAERLRARFHDVFAPYAEAALAQNIRWPTLLKIASLVQREAAGESDMPLIAGIIWNRLLDDMRLQIDATTQYARDTVLNYEMYGGDCVRNAANACVNRNWVKTYFGGMRESYTWWQPLASGDTDIPLSFNTYRFSGLPPRPIANPGTAAIEAVLYPTETECLFYLHDEAGNIYCAETFAGHQENIEQYLR